MNKKELAEAQALIDAVANGTINLDKPSVAVFPKMPDALEFYQETWIKEAKDDPRGDWPIRMADEFLELYLPADLRRAIDNLATSETKPFAATLREVIERGLSGLADDRGEG